MPLVDHLRIHNKANNVNKHDDVGSVLRKLCVCVCVLERERERESYREISIKIYQYGKTCRQKQIDRQTKRRKEELAK